MTFNEACDRWYDALIVYAQEHPCVAMECLGKSTTYYPTKKNLQTLRHWVRSIKNTRLRDDILDTIDNIRSFKGEFRFTYHTYPKFTSQSSTCGELFSFIRQAVNYTKA